MALSNSKSHIQEIRELAENDLVSFARLVNPNYVYGDIHYEMFRFLMQDEEDNQLILIPRGHLKSHCIATYTAWMITRQPDITTLYVSATSTLAEAQLFAIKNILISPEYRRYWPEMVNKEEGKRERWTAGEIIVDHQKRKYEATRDATVKAVGLTTTTTGLHADLVVSDDVVVPENAYTEDGRRKTSAAMSQVASIKNAGGLHKAVGTRYHPRDQYSLWLEQKKKVYEDGEFIKEVPVWDVFERVVEQDGDFLWPRERRSDGRSFGFDLNTLAAIEAEYEDRSQFAAQYYNNPNDPASDRIARDRFQYYDKKWLEMREGDWHFKDNKLNIAASIDFAYSVGRKSDYSAISVVGVDAERNYYVLDIVRFQTDSIATYFKHIADMHSKWQFRKLRAEVSVAQGAIVRDLKDSYIKPQGLAISIDEFRPTRSQGNKEERIAAVLEPKYENQQVWHYKGGYMNMLEDELVLSKPPHDDLKDSLASTVDALVPPARRRGNHKKNHKIIYSSRFGGVAI